MTRDRAVPAVARWCARARRRSPFAGDADALFETDAEKSARHEKARITKVSGPHLAALEATRLPAITGRAVRDIMAECADIAASARCVRCVCVWKWGEAGRHLDCYQEKKNKKRAEEIFRMRFARNSHLRLAVGSTRTIVDGSSATAGDSAREKHRAFSFSGARAPRCPRWRRLERRRRAQSRSTCASFKVESTRSSSASTLPGACWCTRPGSAATSPRTDPTPRWSLRRT